MMTKMTGLLVRVLDDEARVQIGPYEYQVMVPEAVRRVIQMRTGQEITFHISEYFEGNAGGNRFVPRRIGFLTEAELDFFDLFCTVEKIGAKKALKAMARPVKEIADAIARQDSRWLSTLPGIGATTAEQIVTTLKRKVAQFAMSASASPAPEPVPETAVAKAGGRRKQAAPAPESAPAVVEGNVIEDVYQALMALGHNPFEARTKLDSLLSSGKPFKTLDEAISLIYSGNKG
ncbi:MAG TPA: Holliday junction branch migration protein RuvA [Gemmataceae bacterium]|nr:Holliday junction branch migration protein RuvA [Gemmataceae bacterium]